MSDCKICGGCICHQMKGDGLKEDIKEEIVKIVKKVKPLAKKGKDKVMEKVMEKVMDTKMGKEKVMEKVMETKGKGVKAPSKWLSHVKSVAKEKGISYKEAMKVASATYTK